MEQSENFHGQQKGILKSFLSVSQKKVFDWLGS